MRGRDAVNWLLRKDTGAERQEAHGMNGWLMWGLILPVLLVVAGIIAIRRRKE